MNIINISYKHYKNKLWIPLFTSLLQSEWVSRPGPPKYVAVGGGAQDRRSLYMIYIYHYSLNEIKH